MEKVYDYIIKNQLIKPGEIIGVACSGGRDSIALLHYLNSIKDSLECKVLAINVDHCIREKSAMDTIFVEDFCKENKIKLYKFKVDALKIAREEGIGTEEAARKARYGVFEALVQKGVVDKIALAHHLSDQTETILLNIFRGSGITGAKGMSPIRDGIYIRPFLSTSREEIDKYNSDNVLSFVEDETNKDNGYARNFLRNIVIPMIKKHFPALDKNLQNFKDNCTEDLEYINSQIPKNAYIKNKDVIRLPISMIQFPPAIINRILLEILSNYTYKDIERKHINIIKQFAIEAKNGSAINLPEGIKVYKEYDFITFTPKTDKTTELDYTFKKGKTYIPGFGGIRVVSSKVFNEIKENQQVVDAFRIPENAKWRFMEEGDLFKPFKSTTERKLADYFTEKKIPKRLRNNIPVLANGKKILLIADVEISDDVKVTDDSTELYKINYTKDLY